jgi:hypothetical protein
MVGAPRNIARFTALIIAVGGFHKIISAVRHNGWRDLPT